MQGQVLLVENPREPIKKQYEQGGQISLDGMPLKRMHFRSPKRVHRDTTYVFPRLPGGGVILGGCRIDNSWDGEVDLEFAEDIKQRCCALAPELGKPENLKVILHGVGLRRKSLWDGILHFMLTRLPASRKGGARVERTLFEGSVLVHNYGAGGAGYQASWLVDPKSCYYDCRTKDLRGMAKYAVDLLQNDLQVETESNQKFESSGSRP